MSMYSTVYGFKYTEKFRHLIILYDQIRQIYNWKLNWDQQNDNLFWMYKWPNDDSNAENSKYKKTEK